MNLPSDIEAERSVLGALLVRPEGWPEVLGLIEADDFWQAEHRLVFDAIATAASAGSFDMTDVLAELRRRGGDPLLVRDIAADVPTPKLVRKYARAVLRASQQRRLVKLLAAQAERAASDLADPATLVSEVEASVRDIAERGDDRARSIAEVIDEMLEDMESGVGLIADMPLGLSTLDEMLDGGLWGGRLYVVGARPGIGKTSLACNVALRAVTSGRRVLFASVEMSGEEITVRMLSDFASMTATEVRQPSKFVTLIEKAADWPIEYLDGPTTVAEIARKARRTKPELIVVDYLQLVSPTVRRDNRATEVADVSGDLKRLARELDVPVLACAQLNREVEGRGDQKPRLSDLRESGAIENDADVVLLLHRRKDRSPYEALAIVSKNRHGSDGEVSLAFKPRFARFEVAS